MVQVIEKKFREFTQDADAHMARDIAEARIKAVVASDEHERKRSMLLAAIDRYGPLAGEMMSVHQAPLQLIYANLDAGAGKSSLPRSKPTN